MKWRWYGLYVGFSDVCIFKTVKWGFIFLKDHMESMFGGTT